MAEELKLQTVLHLENRTQTKNIVIGLGICLMVIGVYNALLFNRYCPLSEGWFSVFADQILKGQLPYRDFHLFLPPLYPYIIASFIDIFGYSVILLRIFGFVLILATTVILFLLLARLFPAYIASVVTIVSIIYYQSNVTFIAYDFMNLLSVFALLGTLCICKYHDYDDYSFKTGRGWLSNAFIFSAGILAALAFLTKQSNGLCIVAFSFVAIAISAYAKQGLRHAFRSMAIYVIGVLVPLLVTLIWLISNGIVHTFFDQVFIGAASTKGGLSSILFAWIPRFFNIGFISMLIVVICTISVMRICCFTQGFALNKLADKNTSKYLTSSPKMMILFAVIFIIFMLCILLPYWNSNLSYKLFENYFLNRIFYKLIIIGFTSSLIIFCIYLFKSIKERNGAYLNIVIISTASLGLLLGTATSVVIGDMGMILAFGLVLGYLFYIPSHFHIVKIALFVFCLILVLFMASAKYITPYDWWGLEEPDIRTATNHIDTKYLEGFILSEQTARIYKEVTATIDKYTRPGDHIYTFPNIPIFYLLTNRYPDTFALVSWFDVLPDKLAIEDARRIRESPPKIIIWLDIPDLVWDFHEQGFRKDSIMGQRQIKATIKELTSTGQYVRYTTYNVPYGNILTIWIRTDVYMASTPYAAKPPYHKMQEHLSCGPY
jgi:hypothetical protein